MSRWRQNPDAYDEMRDDALTEQKPGWPAPPDGMSATVNARLQEQAARIASLEAQLAAAQEQRDAVIEAVLGEEWELSDSQMDSVELGQIISEQIEQYRATVKHYEETAAYNGQQWRAATERERAATANKKQLAQLALWFGVCISDDGGTLWCRSCGARLDEDDDNFTTGHYTPCTLNDAAAAALAAAQPPATGRSRSRDGRGHNATRCRGRGEL